MVGELEALVEKILNNNEDINKHFKELYEILMARHRNQETSAILPLLKCPEYKQIHYSYFTGLVLNTFIRLRDKHFSNSGISAILSLSTLPAAITNALRATLDHWIGENCMGASKHLTADDIKQLKQEAKDPIINEVMEIIADMVSEHVNAKVNADDLVMVLSDVKDGLRGSSSATRH